MINVDNDKIDDQIIFIGPDDDFLARQWASEGAARVPEVGETVRFQTTGSYDPHAPKGQFVVEKVWHNVTKYNREVEVYLAMP
jgi:hypothetical protein